MLQLHLGARSTDSGSTDSSASLIPSPCSRRHRKANRKTATACARAAAGNRWCVAADHGAAALTTSAPTSPPTSRARSSGEGTPACTSAPARSSAVARAGVNCSMWARGSQSRERRSQSSSVCPRVAAATFSAVSPLGNARAAPSDERYITMSARPVAVA
eukprot:2027749-Prymnesium_polylepis.2